MDCISPVRTQFNTQHNVTIVGQEDNLVHVRMPTVGHIKTRHYFYMHRHVKKIIVDFIIVFRGEDCVNTSLDVKKVLTVVVQSVNISGTR